MIGSILAMTICILLSGYFSATETAFSSINKTRLRAMAEKGSRKAALTLHLAEDYNRLISTILIGNNIVNIAVASIGTVLFIDLLGEESGPAVSTAVVTVVVLIFGEITPKSIAKDFPEKFAMFSAPILNVIIWCFTPLNWIFSQWKRLVSHLFRSSDESRMSQEELLLLLDEVQQEGAIDENENALLKKAVGFGDLEAQDILTHRVNLEGISVDASGEEAAALFDQTHFSRLPVYEESLDNIVGILYQKNFYTGGKASDRPIRELMTPPLFVHRSEKIDLLLQKLRSTKSHIAVVVDEFGGTLGIVTMEDILEELVGEIWDEHDVVEEPVEELAEGTYRIDGAMSLGDFCSRFGLDIESESVSVGGWIMDELDCIPQEGQSFRFADLEITVTHVEDHRVDFAEVRVIQDS